MRPARIAVLALCLTAAIFGASSVGASTQSVARHALLIRVRGHNQLCLWQIPEPPLGRPEKLSDHFQLRAPGRGIDPTGPVLARALSAAWTPRHCGIDVTFRVRSDVGQFSFYDATTGGIWFGLYLPRLLNGRWTRTVIALGPR
jgi:hypothetical protein